MALPNVNVRMPSLSSLQIVPPPKHGDNDTSSPTKEPSVPPLPLPYCQEQRDDVPTTPRQSVTAKPPPRVPGWGQHQSSKRDDNKGLNTSAGQGGVDRDSIVATAVESAKTRRQKSMSRKRGDEIIAPTSSATASNSSRKKSSNNLSALLSTGNSTTHHSSSSNNNNIIMIGTQRVYPRTLVKPTIYHNTATDLWIAIIHTDASSVPAADDISNTAVNLSGKQKAFSFQDEKSARTSAFANSPPVLIPFGTTPQCMLCDTSFTFLRRPKHCKNCGIVICGDCCIKWNTKMMPETYNNKTLGLSKTARVCVSCDSLAKRFKSALMMGRYDMAVEGYLTGNINLRCPFVFKGEKEIMFPIHCAILGQSERLLRWLVDVQCCPIHVVSTANKGKKSYEEDVLPTLQTSKGRSVMDIVMEIKHVGILKYLVKERGVKCTEVKDLGLVLGALEATIMAFPEDIEDSSSEKENGPGKKEKQKDKSIITQNTPKNGQNTKERLATNTKVPYSHRYSLTAYSPKEKSLIPRDMHAVKGGGLYGVGLYAIEDDEQKAQAGVNSDDDCSVCTTVDEMCIVCNEMAINCVATPCGHQVCCMTCSNQMTACPSCNVKCQFIEIYQP